MIYEEHLEYSVAIKSYKTKLVEFKEKENIAEEWFIHLDKHCLDNLVDGVYYNTYIQNLYSDENWKRREKNANVQCSSKSKTD